MSVDRHTLQQWIAGTEVRFRKTRNVFAAVPLMNKLGKFGATTQEQVVIEKIDLTRARDFCVQESSEDLLIASVQLPIFGKRVVGNDVGIAIASFRYTDLYADEHTIIAICAYSISGVVQKTRELKQVIAVPMKNWES